MMRANPDDSAAVAPPASERGDPLRRERLHALRRERLHALRRERLHALRFGWSSLTFWASLGLALEAAHGFKLAAYLDDPMTRQLLVLGHAHGVGLALLMLVYARAGTGSLLKRHDQGRGVRHRLMLAAVLMPVGFCLSALAHPEGDPGWPIVLVPLGALVLIRALSEVAYATWRQS